MAAPTPTQQDRETVLVGASTGAGHGVEMAAVRPGETIGRYTVVEEIGSGGMGVVYRARDPSLNRDVALKLLRCDRLSGSGGSFGEARLVREAQAMAQLSHPHVVSVFDVGVVDNSVFIAMELIEGQTLRTWLGQGRHPTAEVLDVFQQAGRGLLAAHEAGLVHRDFKPDNVLMYRTAEPSRWTCKVLDFGLARTLDDAIEPGRSNSSGGARVSGELTEQGVVMGTPAYMAPEQHRGETADALSDQYSFCVALYEAVHGRKPFRGESLQDLSTAKQSGRLLEAATRKVPGWLAPTILRGLEPRPEDRWPSMDALLDTLARYPRSNWQWLTAGGVAAVGAAAIAGWWVLRGPEVDCTRGGERLVGIWDEASKQAVHDSLLQTGVTHAENTWTRVEVIVDHYAAAWISQHGEVCEATHQRSGQSATVLDLRSACLDDGRAELAALVDVFRNADRQIAGRAVEASAALPALRLCSDESVLPSNVPPPQNPVVASRVKELREHLGEVRAFAQTGQASRAEDLSQAVLSEARELGYVPVLAEALGAAGRLRSIVGDYPAAESLLTEGYWVAREIGHDVVAASIAVELVVVLGDAQARFDEALEWAKHARADIARADPDGDLRRRLLNALGAVHFRQGDYEQSRRVSEQSLELEESPEALINLGNVLAYRGEMETARSHYQRAADRVESDLGPEHPELATAIMNVGSVSMRMGDFDAAEPAYARAIAIYENSLGPDHPDVGNPVANMAILMAAQKRFEEAKAHFERAIVIWETALGPDHPVVGQSYGNLARMLLESGDPEPAVDLLRRAITIEEKVFGADAPATVVTRTNLARALLLLGRTDEARRHAQRALELSAAKDVPLTERALAREVLAEVLWKQGDRDGALAHATESARLFGEAPDDYDASRIRVEDWLRERAG